RERNVPYATAARELAFARAITAQFMRAAPSVVMSHALMRDEHEQTPSHFIASLPQLDDKFDVITPTARTLFDVAPAPEEIVDDAAPAFAAGSHAPGGAGLIEAQSDCPFRAVARYRLQTNPWPVPCHGLT